MNIKHFGRVAVRVSVAALAVGGLAFASVGTASAAPSGSYPAQSQNVSVGTDIGEHVWVGGNCAPGYHVRGGYEDLVHQWIPDVTLDKDDTNGSMYWTDPIAYNHIDGGEVDSRYQGFAVAVYNRSFFNTETTRVNWTCDPN